MDLYPYQLEAVEMLKTGSILNGGVGSGKSLTSLWYYYTKVCNNLAKKIDLYIITTARKRDTCEWPKEMANLGLYSGQINVVIDSWNNVHKYVNIKNSFFIFDEQRVVGYGAWTRSFLKITRANDWILLSATPGDTWMDYAPVFIANGFYRNRTEFIKEHVVYNNYVNFPQIKCYINCSKLVKLRDSITVNMDYHRSINIEKNEIFVEYDKVLFKDITEKRWNSYDNCPIENASQLYYLARKAVNLNKNKLFNLLLIYQKHHKIIVFYNFNYELEMLEEWAIENDITLSQWNGRQHETIPDGDNWVYLVQYTSGAEGWNCVDTDTMVFFSLNPSYKQMVQASGRINRCNSPFNTLYYYAFMTKSLVDKGILMALSKKQEFNAKDFETMLQPF